MELNSVEDSTDDVDEKGLLELNSADSGDAGEVGVHLIFEFEEEVWFNLMYANKKFSRLNILSSSTTSVISLSLHFSQPELSLFLDPTIQWPEFGVAP